MKSYRPLFGFLAILLIASLACGSGSPAAPTPFPTLPPVPTNAPLPTNPPPPTAEPAQNDPVQTSPTNDAALPNDDTVLTYTDQNNLWQFNLPGNWEHTYNDLGKSLYTDTTAYVDKFNSPDGLAYIDSLVMFADKGVKVDNGTSQYVALDIINTYYSKTGKPGDIRIKSDQIMKDGSERFQWVSKGGFYSGVSYFEVRGSDKRTWLMWTLVWDDDAPQSTIDIINAAIDSYVVP
ncbi:MAG: hypothetical protein LC099_02695 [Anaerolineales bacterium]|nr:hypothetical protein [Anaerolineales bacterium]